MFDEWEDTNSEELTELEASYEDVCAAKSYLASVGYYREEYEE